MARAFDAGALCCVQNALRGNQNVQHTGAVPKPYSVDTEPVSATEHPPRALRRTAPQRSKPSSGHGPSGEEGEMAVRVREQLHKLRMLQDVGSTLLLS